jgi:hypothetical protein
MVVIAGNYRSWWGGQRRRQVVIYFNIYIIYILKYENMKEKESRKREAERDVWATSCIFTVLFIKQYYITLFYRETMSSDQETLK